MLDRFREAIEEQRLLRAVPGVAVGVRTADRTCIECFGVTSVEHPLAITATTVLPDASVWKGSRYERVADQKAAGFPVNKACGVAEVSTSGFCDWCTRETAGPTEREIAEADLVALMREIFDAAGGNYGVPWIHRELRHGGGVNEKRVRRLMRKHGMAGRCIRRRVRTTFPGADGYAIPELVGRAFNPGAPEVAWRQDITYIATGEGSL